MGTLNKLGGAILALLLGVAVLAGLSNGAGQEALSSFWHGTTTLFGALGGAGQRLTGGNSARGNLGRSLLIGLAIFFVAVLGLPAARARIGITAAVATVITLLLFSPSLLSQISAQIG